MQGKTINGFELKRRLGVGGMAEVWYAENEIGMVAAVKILSKELSNNDVMKDRFLNEAKVMVKLNHPNIRKVYGFGSIDDRPCIIMEYLDGNDLKSISKRGRRFSDEELRKWWNQLVDALAYTHKQGIVHRDIKPSNIFIDGNGDAKLLDFGIAKLVDTSTGTMTGSTLGTRIYMSPEQVKDPKRVGAPSDAYSLAISFVHLLTGRAPYDSTTSSDYEIQVSIVTKPIDLSTLPLAWKEMLAPYLEKEADKRPALKPFVVETKPTPKANPGFDDDATVANMPNNIQTSVAERATPQPMTVETKKKSSIVPWLVAGAACIVAVVSLLMGGGGSKSDDYPMPVEETVIETTPIEESSNADYSFDEMGAKVFAESGYLLSGQTYHAQAFVTAWKNTQTKAYIKLDGGAEKEYNSNAQGVINLDFNCGVGHHKYSGYIKMLNPATNEIEDFPFENSFTVAPPAVSVSATKMNVVYRGIDNPIAVGGGVGGEITAKASSGTLTRTGNGTYTLRPGDGYEVTISVNSGGSNLGSMKFRVKDLPKPTPLIRNVVNGQVSKSALLAASRVEAEMKDFEFDGVRYDVVGYTMRYKTKSGTTKETKANGGAFNEEMKNAISAANVGDMFVFTAIQVKGNDGKIKTIETPIGVEIK